LKLRIGGTFQESFENVRRYFITHEHQPQPNLKEKTRSSNAPTPTPLDTSRKTAQISFV